ncbi:FKBP-type peptidyl-prolyl cis-trans isomerase [Streptomyces sp. NBC_00878]|uniref:FKBP-type peptidyl-prolyl cis-trans isomerase n=1 Tax=Streptomyces sp. NBC_00878 TaxID=2975854 RepID=UPI00224D6096|nr:FKBP-type peptidyl-prolyl cis-trans isomerase [Streptomyces sp. NBC_00878]MCX4909596.1 FKBP-type peptidyl-prolyl cis-trans isomerase [Streptomyces sp. NBC_00878]
MRRFAALLITPALVLVGCSSNHSSHQSRPDGWHRPLAAPSAPPQTKAAVPAVVRTDAVLPTVSGKFGRPATISVPKSAPSGKFVVAPQTQGRGRSAHPGDAVVVRYTAKVWRTGKALPGSYGKGARPQVFAVGRGATLPALDRAVQGQRAGSRVLVVAPPAAAYGTTGSAQFHVTGKDTVVFAVDILNVIGAHTVVPGEQHSVSNALPEVHMNKGDGTATLTIRDQAAPKGFVVQRLVDGAGPVVKAGQTLVLQHSSAAWEAARGKDEADLFLSSHADGGPLPVVIGRGNVIVGWDRALVGQRVGSRILAVIPAKLAYGPHPPKGLEPGATVISVLDILAAT